MGHKKVILFSSFLICAVKVMALKLPPYITPCHIDDPNLDECAMRNAKKVLPILINGDPVYKIPVMNPLFIEKIDLPKLTNIKLNLRNVTIVGLNNSDIREIKIDIPARNVSIVVSFPYFEVTGHYDLNGKIILFPIVGSGQSNITYVGGVYKYQFHFELTKRKNVEYMNIVSHAVTFVVERGYFHFDNLFNGNKVLGNQILKLLDENWREVNKDFGPLVAETIDAVGTFTANAILSTIPYDEIIIKK